MNKFKNGRLLIIIATVVTAVLILATGRDSSPTSNEQVNVAVEDLKAPLEDETQIEVTTLKEEAKVEEITEIEVPENKIAQALINSVEESVEVRAPKGPFNSSAVTENKVEEKISEEAIQSLSDEKAELTSGEKLNESVKLESNNLVTESVQSEESTTGIQPIWMSQKLGDFKSIEKGDATITLIPINTEGLQGANPDKVMTTNDDKFAPISALGDYNYQQMPMYNGGYYIAPMPSYLMSSMLPVSLSK